jgi:Flp pilus assembly protein TadG
LIKRLRNRTSDDTGAELIELAMIFPILLLLVAGIVDFGFLFQRYEVVTNAAREGARVGVLPSYTVADVQQRVTDYLGSGGLNAAITPPAVTYCTESLPSGATVPVVQVVVQYPSEFAFIGPIAAMVGGSGWGSVTLTAASVMRVESGGGPGGAGVACT